MPKHNIQFKALQKFVNHSSPSQKSNAGRTTKKLPSFHKPVIPKNSALTRKIPHLRHLNFPCAIPGALQSLHPHLNHRNMLFKRYHFQSENLRSSDSFSQIYQSCLNGLEFDDGSSDMGPSLLAINVHRVEESQLFILFRDLVSVST